MATSVTSAIELYAVSDEFRALIALWDEHRRCPLPLVDFLLEHGLESQAEACRWAAAEKEREVLAPSKGERGGSCGPYPTLLNGWYWSSSNGTRAAHNVPVPVNEGPDGAYFRHPTAIVAILWLLDNWNIKPRSAKPKMVTNAKKKPTPTTTAKKNTKKKPTSTTKNTPKPTKKKPTTKPKKKPT